MQMVILREGQPHQTLSICLGALFLARTILMAHEHNLPGGDPLSHGGPRQRATVANMRNILWLGLLATGKAPEHADRVQRPC